MIGEYTHRLTLIFIVFCFGFITLLANLAWMQLKNGHFFLQLGSRQYALIVHQRPERAPLYDRFGKVIAGNQQCISAFIMPHALTQLAELSRFLKTNFPAAYSRLKGYEKKQFMYVKRRLTRQEQALITNAQLADIKLLHEENRLYPFPYLSMVIGLTDIDNNGLSGLELMYDAQLAGTPTTFSLEHDARSGHFYFNKETKQSGRSSNPLYTTIDSALQFFAYEELCQTIKEFDAQEGSIVIMDPTSGDILTMLSITKDDLFSQTFAITQAKNKIVTESYELGSVIKVFAALAALAHGVVQPDEYIDCKNSTTTVIDGRTINTWKAHGVIPFIDVVAYSNNIGIAIVAKRLGHHLYDHYIRLGFGKKTGLNFPGEQKGFVNHPKNWSKQSIISLSYGYEITATLLQLACAFCVIANDGHPVTPRLIIDSSVDKKPEKQQSQNPLYTQEVIDIIKSILKQTTERGTAKRAGIKGYTIMSKTGTANLLDNGVYNPNKNRYTCAAIVQKDNYQRVIVISIKEAKKKNLYASIVAAPLLERVAERMIIHERII